MSILFLAGIGATGIETSGNTLAIVTTAALNANDVAIVKVACNNVGTTDADFSEISSVTDGAGNFYVKLAEWTNGQGAAAAGVTVSLWMARAKATLASGGTITVNFANTITAKAASVFTFSVDHGLVMVASTQNAPDAVGNYGSLSISGLPSTEYLFVRACAKEQSSATQLTVTTNYTFMGNLRSGANTTSSVMTQGEYRIVTGTTETSNPTHATAGDNASVFVALAEVASPIFPAVRQQNPLIAM